MVRLECRTRFQPFLHNLLRFPQLSPELSATSPTAITAEAKAIEHEFCLILLVWISKMDLLSEVALGIQCCRQDGDCARTSSQGGLRNNNNNHAE